MKPLHEPVPHGHSPLALPLSALLFVALLLTSTAARALEPAVESIARAELPTEAGTAPSAPPLAAGQTLAEPAPADQASDEEQSPPFVDLTIATHLPLSVGGAVTVELPGRLLAQLDVGGLPAFAGSMGGAFIGAIGFNHPNVALATGAFEGTVVARGSAGWRPFPAHGFELTGGYTFISLSGGVTPDELNTAMGGSLPAQVTENVERIGLTSQLHNFHLALGWRWVIGEHFVMRTNIGYTQTLASSSQVEIDGMPEIEARANPVVDEKLVDIFGTYLKLPVLSFAAGYRF